jgi:hypothetical protein
LKAVVFIQATLNHPGNDATTDWITSYSGSSLRTRPKIPIDGLLNSPLPHIKTEVLDNLRRSRLLAPLSEGEYFI